jgi:hypothetical protein
LSGGHDEGVSDPAETSEEPLDLAEIRRLLRTLGMRPSRSAEEAFERSLEEVRAMTAEERILLALRLGRRDRALRGGSR